jgi:hypothetical protein
MKFDACRKSVEKIQVSIQSDENNGYFALRPIYIFHYISLSPSQDDNVTEKLKEKLKRHILCLITLFFENSTVYEMTWKNIVETYRPQMTKRRMSIACWMTKATDTHSEYVKLIAFPQQRWLYEGASVLRYTYLACLVYQTI